MRAAPVEILGAARRVESLIATGPLLLGFALRLMPVIGMSRQAGRDAEMCIMKQRPVLHRSDSELQKKSFPLGCSRFPWKRVFAR